MPKVTKKAPVALRLKRGLRFTKQTRQGLAQHLVTEHFADKKTLLDMRLEKLLIDLYETACEVTGLDNNADKEKQGMLYPCVQFVDINVDDRPHRFMFKQAHYVPFAVLMRPNAFYHENALDLIPAIEDYVRDYRAYAIDRDRAESAMYEFLKGFSSPAKLLEQMPTAKDSFPEEWMEEYECDIPQSISEVINVAA